MLRIVRRAAAGPVLARADLHPVLRRVYAARGVQQAAELDTSLERLLPVGTLEGIAAAVELLARHRAAAACWSSATSMPTAPPARRSWCGRCAAWGSRTSDFLVPNRFRFGYGLTPEIVALALTRIADAHRDGRQRHLQPRGRGERARAAGIEVLITDHHLPAAELPAAARSSTRTWPAAASPAARSPASASRSTCWRR